MYNVHVPVDPSIFFFFLTFEWDLLAKIRQRDWKQPLNRLSCQAWNWFIEN